MLGFCDQMLGLCTFLCKQTTNYISVSAPTPTLARGLREQAAGGGIYFSIRAALRATDPSLRTPTGSWRCAYLMLSSKSASTTALSATRLRPSSTEVPQEKGVRRERPASPAGSVRQAELGSRGGPQNLRPWAVPFIAMPTPKTVCRTNAYNKECSWKFMVRCGIS